MFRSIKFCVEERKQFTQFNLNFGSGRKFLRNRLLNNFYLEYPKRSSSG